MIDYTDLPIYDIAKNLHWESNNLGDRCIRMIEPTTHKRANALARYAVKEHMDALEKIDFVNWEHQQHHLDPLIRFLLEATPSLWLYDRKNNPDGCTDYPGFWNMVFPHGVLQIQNMYPRKTWKYTFSDKSHSFVMPTRNQEYTLRFNHERTHSLKDYFLSGVQDIVDGRDDLQTMLRRQLQRRNPHVNDISHIYTSMYATWACWMHQYGTRDDLGRIREIMHIMDPSNNYLDQSTLVWAIQHTVLAQDAKTEITPLDVDGMV